MNYDLLHIQGQPFVLVPLHAYRTMNSNNEAALPDHVMDALAARQNHPVKILRKFYGMTQEELAEKAKMSRSYLTEIETGSKEGSLKTIKALAGVFGVELGLLI